MVVAKNIPIRLIQKSGGIIPLYATSFTMGATREVGSNPILGGNAFRVGVDLNVVHHSLIIDVVFSDDTEYPVGTTQEKLVLLQGDGGEIIISFDKVWDSNDERVSENLVPLTPFGFRTKMFAPKLPVLEFQTQDRAAGLLTGTNGLFKVEFSQNESKTTPEVTKSEGTPAVYTVSHDFSSASAITEAFAKVFASDVDNTVFTDDVFVNGETNNIPYDAFTLERINGIDQTVANGAVKITSKQTGDELNGKGPTWTTLNDYQPRQLTAAFVGGTKDGWSYRDLDLGILRNKSAGDKVQDLFGLTNNAQSGTIAAGIMAYIFGGPEAWVAGWKNLWASAEERTQYDADFVVGIQIPYASLAHCSTSIPEPVRNFFLTNGIVSADSKGALANYKDAEDIFLPKAKGAEKCGIEGVLQDFDFTYNAGENVYEGKLKFLPLEGLV
jgi:hypothetical protein